ncbi:MAG: calcium-binding protein [Aestuariivirga sp.]
MAVITGDNGNNTLYGTRGFDIIYGLEGDDSLFAFESDDILIGGPGADYLSGGGSIYGDFASYVTATSGVVADFLFPWDNAGDAAGDTYFEVEHIIGSDYDDALGGDNDPNIINGGAGNDFLAGRGGADELFGGAGDDRLNGGEGADRLNGGTGHDVAEYVNSVFGVFVDLEWVGVGGDADGDTYADIEEVAGSKFGDVVNGDSLGNLLYGLLGNDILRGRGGFDGLFGGAGDDELAGGDGNDQLFGEEGSDRLNGGEGDDQLIGAAGNDRLVGDAGNDSLFGGIANDVLDGSAGMDQMLGEAGNDLYYVDSAGDVVDEGLAGSDGNDQVIASISFSLANPVVVRGAVEDLFLSGTADLNGAGNDLNNLLVGNYGRNALSGGAGNDHLLALLGDDVLTGGSGVDTLLGGLGNDIYTVDAANEANETDGDGIDTVRSTVSYGLGAGLESLYLLGTANINGAGNALGNRMIGSAGNNVLIGRLGRDVMTGNAGNDRFAFNSTAESGVTSATRDIITDFNAGTAVATLDRIDVSPIDADALTGGNQSFIFGGPFVAGHIRAVQAGANVVLEFNTDGDAAAEMSIQLNNVLAANLNAGDFVL